MRKISDHVYSIYPKLPSIRHNAAGETWIEIPIAFGYIIILGFLALACVAYYFATR